MEDNEMYKVKLVLTPIERIKCLEEIIKKNKKILYVFEQSQLPNSGYNYKVYVGGLILYVSSSNELFDGDLVNILINLNSIVGNDFDKNQLKRIVHENTNIATFLLNKERGGVSGNN